MLPFEDAYIPTVQPTKPPASSVVYGSRLIFSATFTLFSAVPIHVLSTNADKINNNLIYNAQEVNGLKVAETVYKKDGNMLTNYMKYNYKYNDNNQMTENMSQKWNVNKNCWENDLCIRYTYDNKSVTTEYYKWNSKKNDFILIPEMTVTMDK